MTPVLLMALFLTAAPADYHQLEADAEKAASQNTYVEAYKLYGAALDAARQAVGQNHPDVARLLSRLALIMELQGDITAPEPLYLRAIQILEAPALGAPVELATALELYAGLLNKQLKVTEAEKLRERARPIRTRHIREMLGRLAPPAYPTPAVRIGGGVSAPVLISRSEPKYSPVARLAKLQGTVLLTMVILTDGTVTDIEVQRGIGLGLDEQAVEDLLRWRFEPGTKDGQPVAVKANVEINFRLL